VTVPLDRKGDIGTKRVPADPKARVVVTTPDGATKLDRTVRPGDVVALPSGDSLRLDGVGYYARIQVVDDLTIPILYAGMIVALVGLTVVVVVRQQIVLATAVEGPDGVKLAVRLRLWRNPSSSRDEIESELSKALAPDERGSTS
jgi:cytochrome c biogenesis protein ResB